VIKNRVLRKILGSKGDKVTRQRSKVHNEKHYVSYSLQNVIIWPILSNHENGLGAACDTYGGEKNCIQGLGREACRKENYWETKA
jgi:hypothetical protein